MPRVEVKGKFVMAAVKVWMKACRVLITRVERSRLRPRISRSRDFRRL
jgi:hypothetical protein